MTAIQYNVNAPEAAKLLAEKFKVALPAIGQPLTDGIEITGSGRAQYLNIAFSSSVSNALTLTTTTTAGTDTELLNGGANIPAGTRYQATVLVAPGETINLTYGGTSGTYTCKIGAVVQNG